MPQTRDWTASSFFLRAWHVRRRISKQSLVICNALPGYATSTVLLPHDWGHHWWPCSDWCFLIPGVCLLAWMGRDTPGILGWCINVSEFLGLQSCLDAPCSQRWGTSDNHDDHNQLKWVLSRGVSCNGRLQRWWCLLQNGHDFQVMYQDAHCRLITPLNEERFYM